MSRTSISRRLQALLEAAERVDPQAVAVHRMAPATRLRFDAWRTECDRLTDEMGGGEALYRSYLDADEWPLPPPPKAVAAALGLDARPIVTDDTDIHDLAEAWAAMIES